MTIKDVVYKLQQEKQENIVCRFPCRIILVKNIKQYCCLLSELKKINGIRVVKSSEIIKSPDVMPQYNVFNSSDYYNEWVILTGIGEYLRLFLQYETNEKRFSDLWHLIFPSISHGRIIIPIWGFDRQWMETILHLKNSRQEDYFFDCTDNCMPEQKMDIRVYSKAFGMSVPINDDDILFDGLRSMFEYWENPSSSKTDFVLITRLDNKIAQVSGDINIHVIRDLLTYLRENMR